MIARRKYILRKNDRKTKEDKYVIRKDKYIIQKNNHINDICKSIPRKNKLENGSITVFLTLVFVIILSLVATCIEVSRIATSGSYVKVAAENAALCTFGCYNLELFNDYHLYAYGGYDGIDVNDMQFDLNEYLNKNLKAKPDNSKRMYSDIYRFENESFSINTCSHIYEYDSFIRQVKRYLISSNISEIKNLIFSDNDENNKNNIVNKDISARLENGNKLFDEKDENTNSDKSKSNNNNSDKSKSNNTNSDNRKSNNDSNSNESNKILENNKNKESELKKDSAGGNPLTFFVDFMKNGLLDFVCDKEKLSDNVMNIDTVDGNVENTDDLPYGMNSNAYKKYKSYDDKVKEKNAGKILKNIINDTDSIKDNTTDNIKDNTTDSIKDNTTDSNITDNTKDNITETNIQQPTDKLYLLAWIDKFIPSYVNEKSNVKEKYGVEYLLGGRKEEKDNLISVINKIILTRIAINYIYVIKNPILKEKSIATAAIITGVTCTEEFAEAISQMILVILSIEEALIDTIALLNGDKVPFIKNDNNFQMKYEEICIANKSLFQEKAKKYNKEVSKLGFEKKISYKDYLNLYLMCMSKEKLVYRICELVQYDLRKKYNESFCIEACVTGVKTSVSYEIPFIYSGLSGITYSKYFLKSEISSGRLLKRFELNYLYD